MDDIAIAAYGFVMIQRERFPIDNQRVLVELVDPQLPAAGQMAALVRIAAAATEQMERLMRQFGDTVVPKELIP